MSPTSYALLVACLVTVGAKTAWVTQLGSDGGVGTVIYSAAADVAVYLGFAALFAAGEAITPRIYLATVPLTLLVAAVAGINAWYLTVTGEQLTWDLVELGLGRFSDVWRVVHQDDGGFRTAVTMLAALAALPVGLRLAAARYVTPGDTHGHGYQRAHAALFTAVLGVLLWLVWPAPDTMAARRMRPNAAVQTYWTWVTAPEPLPPSLEFQGYDPPYLVTVPELERLTVRPDKVNVLFVVLESTRLDHTSLATGGTGRAETPHLAALGEAGTYGTRVRAVLPHTTKSLFSMLCGRYPLMQRAILEIHSGLEVQCLPAVLAAAGYRTAFFQSAFGTFEERPRLVDRLGFQHFQAYEDIGGEALGYLASDDMSLAAPFTEWLEADPEGPFFATVLTSATHHPYLLPEWVAQRAAQRGKPAATETERYARLVEAQDELVGRLLETLERHELRDDTIVVVAGDHGEGFGDMGVRQHDSNFFEEGLRVPLVFSGPGVPHRVIERNATLGDVLPSLAGLLGARIAPETRTTLIGEDWFAGELDPDRVLPFSCWFEYRCQGFVQGDRKLVWSVERAEAHMFDLTADPAEAHPKPVPDELVPRLTEVGRLLSSHRTYTLPLHLGEVRRFPPWRCPEGRRCEHRGAAAPNDDSP